MLTQIPVFPQENARHLRLHRRRWDQVVKWRSLTRKVQRNEVDQPEEPAGEERPVYKMWNINVYPLNVHRRLGSAPCGIKFERFAVQHVMSQKYYETAGAIIGRHGHLAEPAYLLSID